MSTFPRSDPELIWRETETGGIELLAPDEDKAWEWRLVLTALDIPCCPPGRPGPTRLRIPAPGAERALREIEAYEEDCATWNTQGPPLIRRPGPKSWSPAWVMGMLAFFYVWIGPYDQANAVARAGALDSTRFLDGEVWRAVTSLTLHADGEHLLGNLVSIGLFGWAACRIFGAGAGWLLILLSGIIGNSWSAAVYGPGHISVGASTACFGALGLLCGSRMRQAVHEEGWTWSIWNRVWLPAAAGLGLLALLGTGMRSDLLAHALGFLSGLILGWPSAFLGLRQRPILLRMALQVLALSVVMLSWRWAFHAVSAE